jgi:hypothetical protein
MKIELIATRFYRRANTLIQSSSRRRGMVIVTNYSTISVFALLYSPAVTNSFSTTAASPAPTLPFQTSELNTIGGPAKGNPAYFPSVRRGFSALKDTALSSSTTISENVDKRMTTGSMTSESKVEALRKRMKQLDLDIYLIPSDDPHLSGKKTKCPFYLAIVSFQYEKQVF